MQSASYQAAAIASTMFLTSFVLILVAGYIHNKLSKGIKETDDEREKQTWD